MKPEPEVVEVDPARLASGVWDHERDDYVGEGDIQGSYSADRIGMGQPIRRPFKWRGGLWVCTGSARIASPAGSEAYRLVDPAAFPGAPTTYSEKTQDAEAARNDPLGFYHGMTVRSGGKSLILCGPPALFIPGRATQPDLFSAIERSRSAR